MSNSTDEQQLGSNPGDKCSYRYFVSYAFTYAPPNTAEESGNGMCDIKMDKPITSWDVIRGVQEHVIGLLKKGIEARVERKGRPVNSDCLSVVILNYIPLDKGDDHRERFLAAFLAVEEGLAERKLSLPPAKRAEMILAAYDLMAK